MESERVTVSRRPARRPLIRQRPTHSSPWRRRRAHPVVATSWTSAAGQRVCRKYRRGRHDVGRLQQREYDKLRRIVPALRAANRKPNQPRHTQISKVKVVEETIRYIDQLHRMLAKRVQADDISDKAAVVDAAKTAFICQHQLAADAESDNVAMGNSRHGSPATADVASVSRKTASSPCHSLSDTSTCPADR